MTSSLVGGGGGLGAGAGALTAGLAIAIGGGMSMGTVILMSGAMIWTGGFSFRSTGGGHAGHDDVAQLVQRDHAGTGAVRPRGVRSVRPA